MTGAAIVSKLRSLGVKVCLKHGSVHFGQKFNDVPQPVRALVIKKGSEILEHVRK